MKPVNIQPRAEAEADEAAAWYEAEQPGLGIEFLLDLAAASDDEVRAEIRESLVWLQDMNWPVAPLVAERVSKLGLSLTAPLSEILRGSDEFGNTGLLAHCCQQPITRLPSLCATS